MSTTVPTVQTPIGDVALAEALARAHAEVFGAPPSRNRLGLAWAQIWGETGWGAKSFNHNLGNIKCTPGWTECMRLHDELPDWQTNPGALYRSYPSFDAGAEDYWRLMRGRYGAALDAADEGDTERMALELKKRGYFSVSAAYYALGLRNNWAEFKRRFERGTRWASVLPLLAASALLTAALWWVR